MAITKLTVVNLSYNCNLRCLFCSVGDKLNSASDLRIEELLGDPNFGKGGGALQISGGEPTLLEKLPEFCREAKRRFSEIILLTNGVLLSSRAKVESLLASGVSTFVVPMYANNEHAHDAICGVPGSFMHVKDGMRNLSQLRKSATQFKFIVKILPLSFPCSEPWAIPEKLIANSIRPDEIVLSGIYAGGNMRKHHSLLPTAAEISRILERVIQDTLCSHIDFSILDLPLCLLKEDSLKEYLRCGKYGHHHCGLTYTKYGNTGVHSGRIHCIRFSCCRQCDLNWTCGGIPPISTPEMLSDFGRNSHAIMLRS